MLIIVSMSFCLTDSSEWSWAGSCSSSNRKLKIKVFKYSMNLLLCLIDIADWSLITDQGDCLRFSHSAAAQWINKVFLLSSFLFVIKNVTFIFLMCFCCFSRKKKSICPMRRMWLRPWRRAEFSMEAWRRKSGSVWAPMWRAAQQQEVMQSGRELRRETSTSHQVSSLFSFSDKMSLKNY